MNGGKVVYIGEHTPWPSYVAVTRERGYPESRRYYQRETCKRTWTGLEMICSGCGHQLTDPTARFCKNCGRKVVEG